MRPAPRSLIASKCLLAALLALTACSRTGATSAHPPESSDPPPNVSSAAASSATATVPVEQIPPGRPESWVPAGVPTTARWKEPGDEVPRFTLAMFDSSPKGAMAVVNYYLTARNWAIATLDPTPYLTICDSQRCKDDGELVRKSVRAGQHVVGGRQSGAVENLRLQAGGEQPRWIAQLPITFKAGVLTDGSGRAISRQSSSTRRHDIYLRWNGVMWRVEQDLLAG